MDSINSNKKNIGSSNTIEEIETDNVIEYFNDKEKLSPLEDNRSVDSSSNDNLDDSSNKNSKFHITQPHLRKFIDSFKRPEHTVKDLEDPDAEDSLNDGEGKLKSTIKPRHVLMMSLGTGIGTGLLVGNATALRNAGPAGLVIGYAIMGSCLYCIIQVCGELAVCYAKLPGNFNAYPSFLVDPALGFSVAWVYCLQWLCVTPLELVTASMTIKYWTTKVDPDVFVVIFYVLIIVINIFGAQGYAEAEFFFNSCKVLMITGFFILGIITICGKAGNDGYIGTKYWHEPGAFNGDHAIDRFKGVMAVFVRAAFAMGASEFISITAAEQSNPRKAIPRAAKTMIYRIVFIFLTSITLIGFLVPYDSDQLMGSGSSATKASPYVIAIASHGVRVVPHFINAVILLSVLSVANSAFYSSSRLLHSLAGQGYAPKIFLYLDREGRPAIAMICSALFGVIAFCASSPKEEQVFTWLLAISGLSQLFTWITICFSHLRFRRALFVQGRSTDELGYKSQVGVWGSAYAATMMILALIAQFWVAIAPIGEGKLDAQAFFENYLAMPILIAFYLGYKIWKRDWSLFIRADKVDLVTHRKIFDGDLLRQEEEELKEKLKNGPFWKRVVDFLF
ncbi:General amino acid permease [Maudiozyma exigua]|uniref:General amino acid permease n=1 Tax=Maudiozyma exigua TaxID=34358 RepID=A0A9P6WCU0_MAUEX|nr:General amino acid permease [Kazachstania exigua]